MPHIVVAYLGAIALGIVLALWGGTSWGQESRYAGTDPQVRERSQHLCERHVGRRPIQRNDDVVPARAGDYGLVVAP
jgi:hypothetical protein